MMKKCSPFIVSLLVAFMFCLHPLTVQAAPDKTVTKEYLSDGSYYETVISTHKILSKTSGRSGNSGWAKATVGTYMGGVHVTDVTRTIYIYCDKNGDVS